MASQTEPKTYRGNCHCGKLVYEVKLPEIKKAYSCNCSHCFKKGILWNFLAPNDGFTWVKGDVKDMTKYTFGNGELTHHFCPNCGISLIGNKDGKVGAVNLRTLQGPPGEAFNLWDLELVPIDGASYEPKYVTPPNLLPEPSAEGTLYRGNCHCGKVTWTLKNKDLTTLDPKPSSDMADRIAECNCSMCQRAGYIWVYPKADPTVFGLSGREHTNSYKFSSRIAQKLFCATCGVHVTNETNHDLSEEEIKKLPEFIQLFRQRMMQIMPVNMRTMEDIELVQGLKTMRFNGWVNAPGDYRDP